MNKQKTDDAYGTMAVFTKQDMELVAAFRRIQKFRIKKNKDLKAGWILNIRETHALRNAYVEPIRINGRPHKDRATSHSQWWIVDRLKSHPYDEDYIHCDTLIKYNHGYKLNAKTKAFSEMLEHADRFQQYCILRRKPYTKQVFDEWKSDMQFNRWQDEESQKDFERLY